ncbi:ECF transporter S component [Desemzia incerta]|uniref:ECF transporter S component n=1 Tax=Desemzia incerta TaxID=82801 RepID=UPI0024C2E21B|nr:ECF transporter S component [Desemzia incerta]WHZ31665.1 ECF transporter S component [Desemzia incerta]
MKNTKNKAYRIAVLGIFTAIILLQSFVPFLGYIPIPPLNPTIIHITVIIAAISLGTKEGMIIGGVWGVVRLIRAFAAPQTPLDPLIFTNPLISVLPRILVGLVAGLVFYTFRKKGNQTFGMALSAVLASLTNTIVVLSFIYLFYKDDYAAAINVDSSNLMYVLGGVVLTNGVAEAVAAGILGPIIAKPLLRVAPKKTK